MACAAEEQAVEMVKAGPVIPNSIEMWLAPALAIVLGMVSGWTRLCPSCRSRRSRCLRYLPAYAGSGDDGRGLAQLGRPLDARVLHRLARGDHRELREAVDEIGAPVFEVGLVAVAFDFGAVLKAQRVMSVDSIWPDAAAALAQRFGELAVLRPRALIAPCQ